MSSQVQVWCLTKSNKVIKMENEKGIKKCSMFGRSGLILHFFVLLLLLRWCDAMYVVLLQTNEVYRLLVWAAAGRLVLSLLVSQPASQLLVFIINENVKQKHVQLTRPDHNVLYVDVGIVFEYQYSRTIGFSKPQYLLHFLVPCSLLQHYLLQRSASLLISNLIVSQIAGPLDFYLSIHCGFLELVLLFDLLLLSFRS